MKIFKSKHVRYFMPAMVFGSVIAIQLLMIKDDWVTHGQATLLNIGLGILISAIIVYLFGWLAELNQRRTGSGVYEKKDLRNNAKGIAAGAVVTILLMVVFWVISLF